MHIAILFTLILLIPHSVHADITTGLVGHWKLDDGAGTNADDSSATGADGTLSGATIPTWVTGTIGPYALNFDGSTGYVNVPDNAALDPTAVSVAAWVKADAFPNSYNTVVHKGTATNYYEFFVRSTGKMAMYIKGTGTTRSYDGTGSSTLSAGAWYHVVMTYNTTTGLHGYVNGVADGSNAASSGNIVDTATALSIGRDSVTSGRFFDGDIDDVRVYNRKLSADDVAELYAYTEPVATSLPYRIYTVGQMLLNRGTFILQ